MKRICIAKKKEPVALAQLSQQADRLGGKVQEECIPAVDYGLIGRGAAGQLSDGVDKFPIADPADLIVPEEGGCMANAEILPDASDTEGGKSLFWTPVIQIEDDTAQVKDDIFYALHEPALFEPGYPG